MYRNSAFRCLIAARTISTVGDAMLPIAVAFAVLDVMHLGTASLATVLTAEMVGAFAFMLIGGVLADRIRVVRGMIVADLVSTVIQMVAALLLVTGVMTVPVFSLLLVIKGIATAFFMPAAGALLPRIVAGDELQKANAHLEVATSLAMVFGPPLAGAVVTVHGASVGIAFDALTFAASAALLAGVRVRSRTGSGPDQPNAASSGPRQLAAELRVGLREVKDRRWLLASIAGGCALALLGSGPFFALLPFVARRSFGGPVAYSWMMCALAVGSLIGAVTVARYQVARPLFTGTLVLVGAGMAPVALAAPAPLLVVLVSFGLAGASQAVSGILWGAGIAQLVPPEALGRVSACDMLGSLALRPAGQALGGVLATAVGFVPVLYLTAGAFFLTPLSLLAVLDIRRR